MSQENKDWPIICGFTDKDILAIWSSCLDICRTEITRVSWGDCCAKALLYVRWGLKTYCNWASSRDYRRPAKAQASLHICAVSSEPSLFAHTNYGYSRRAWPKIRHLAPLDEFTRMKSTLISWDGSIILKFEQYGFTIHLHVCIQKMQHLCIQKMQLHVNVEWQTRPKIKQFLFRLNILPTQKFVSSETDFFFVLPKFMFYN